MKFYTLVFLSLAFGSAVYAQGKFVSEKYKPLIGAKWQKDEDLPLLEGFMYRGGSMLSAIDDEELFGTNWFAKGSTALVFFERMGEDNTHEIIDVLEITGLKKNQEVKGGDCTDGEVEMISLVALVNTSQAERWKALKVWNFNRDKLRIESFNAARVTCLGMIGEDE
ncbi:MAG TPA: hypothetical protein PKJ63_13475 [Cyclobacteriaceae bacterium]|nr:hypothetical protein [Cyclobacteriaceae bacterium]